MIKNLNENITDAAKLVEDSQNIFLASHINPDGDNLGSMLGLALALKTIGKNVIVLKSDIIPSDFTFLPGISLIQEYNESLGNIDLFITLDCSDEERLGDNKNLLEKSNKVINIDHHISNTNFGDINVVNSSASATGEIVYYIIKEMNINLTKEIAINLYTAINTDTGSFKYDSVSSNTHRIVADLLDTRFDKNIININLYENMSFTRMKLFIKSLSSLEVFNDAKVAVIMVTQEMLEETGATLEDAEGIVSFIRQLATVEAACLLKEIEKDNIKISLRTKKYLDASEICQQFDGGGHKRAAGCTIYKPIEESKKNDSKFNPRFYEGIVMNGIINFYKPKGMTSHDAVNFFRRLLNMKKIGHTGTLDPNAEGVLPICIGKATRVSEYLINADKEYLGELTLGRSTDTQDGDGKTINQSDKQVTEEEIILSFDNFKGNISQIPPMYSAIKKNGKKLYELAREGKVIDREPRGITIYKLDIKEITDTKTIKFLTKCSKGTYIRTLCNDIGEDLGTFGYMSDLIRVNVGPFRVEESYKKEFLENMTLTDLNEIIIPIDFALMQFKEINIPNQFYNKLVNGVKIEIHESTHSLETNLRVYSKDKFIGIGEIIEKDHLQLLKMNKVFV